MCGIAGFIGNTSDPVETIRHMAKILCHRGPDNEGLWIDEEAGVALSHRRLSILDLSSAGHQPMISHNGRYVIVFNGEIYNHLELRQELDRKSEIILSSNNHKIIEEPRNSHPHASDSYELRNWSGHSDTETLLEAIALWGPIKALTKCVGMFAFALWDRTSQILMLVCDRMGEKPLYYGWQGESFIFGSELKALRKHPEFTAKIDRDPLSLYFRHGYIPIPYSIYKGIYKLPPGTYLQITVNKRHFRAQNLPKPYWNLRKVAEHGILNPFPCTELEAVDKLECLIDQSIRGQMLADVPIGAFLSGGIDSSIIVAMMQAQSSQPIHTFTIGFYEDEFNEADHARSVAEYLGTDHTELYVTAEKAISAISLLPNLYDEPFADPSQIPAFLISSLARRSVKVCLSGDGGDELFGGYERYLFARSIWKRIRWLPFPLRIFLSRILRRFHEIAKNMMLSRDNNNKPYFDGLISENLIDKLQRIATVLNLESPEMLYMDLVSDWKKPNEIVRESKEPRTVLTDPNQWIAKFGFEHSMMYLDQMSYLPDNNLVKLDRAAMGVSLETRVPLLDHRIVEFAWRLPSSMKIRNGQSKWILRQVLYKQIPRDIVERPKMGFGVPIRNWLRGPLREWAEALLDEKRINEDGFLNPESIRERWIAHLEGKKDWSYYLWDVLMFQNWLDAQR